MTTAILPINTRMLKKNPIKSVGWEERIPVAKRDIGIKVK